MGNTSHDHINFVTNSTALKWRSRKKKDDKHNKSTQIPNFNLTTQSEENQLQTQSSHPEDIANTTFSQNNFQLNKKQTPRLRKYYRKWCIVAKRQILERNQETRNLTLVPTAMESPWSIGFESAGVGNWQLVVWKSSTYSNWKAIQEKSLWHTTIHLTSYSTQSCSVTEMGPCFCGNVLINYLRM